jgi:hypothetical protein
MKHFSVEVPKVALDVTYQRPVEQPNKNLPTTSVTLFLTEAFRE